MIYRMSKPVAYVKNNRNRVLDAYITDYCGQKLAEKKAVLQGSADGTKVLSSLSYGDIRVAE